MSQILTTRGLVAEVGEARFEVQRGLAPRLIATLPLSLPGWRADESDADRVLVRYAILSLEGDLFVVSRGERTLVGGMRHLSPGLPITQGERPRAVDLSLFLDPGDTLARGLAPRLQAGGELLLSLRGVAERWDNPLYDEDGYQKMRVGDSGMSRALQSIGQREHLSIAEVDISISMSKEDRGPVVTTLGAP